MTTDPSDPSRPDAGRPPGYGSPPGYDPRATYGPPPGYAAPPGYGPPPGYGSPPGYDPRATYGPPPGYAAPPGYDPRPALTVADTKRYKGQIPYLGVEPPPSRPIGLALQIVSGITALVLVARAMAYLQRAGLDAQLTAAPNASLSNQLRANTTLLTGVDRVALALLIATAGVSIAWNLKRRPKDLRTRAGEAYVESPLSWAWPPQYRVPHVLLIGAAFFAQVQGGITRSTPVSSLPGLRGWSALAAALFALYFAGCIPMVAVARAEHARRVAWSGPYREQPAMVPYFPAVAGSMTYGTSSSSTSSESEGFLWWLRTAGLITMLLVGSMFAIIGTADVMAGKTASLPFALVGAALDAVAIGVLVRRYRRKQAVSTGTAVPAGGTPWG